MNILNMILENFNLDESLKIPLYQQLGEHIYILWEKGVLKPNDKLPPIRKIASSLDVSNVTIVNAYKYLEEREIAYSIVGSGTYISELTLNEKPIISRDILKKQHPNFIVNINNKETINFAKGSVSPELFPVNEFKSLFNQVLDRDRGNAFGYEEIQGYKPLRESICEYTNKFSINTTPDKIQIISGAQQGIDLISKALLSVGDIVFVESPTYYGAAGAFLSRGAKIIEIPLENNGINISKFDALIKLYKPKLVYLIPYFQTPTCTNISLDKKRKLIELANKYDFYIIEEDNQSDFNFSDDIIIPLKTLDYKNKVIYIKSFSKILMPGLRLGFMILPKTVLERVVSAKYTTDVETSGFIQRAFQLYINSSDWESHILKMHKIFKNRFLKMKQCSDKFLKNKLDFIDPTGGLNYWYKLPYNMDSEKAYKMILKKNVIVYPGLIYSLNGREIPNIRLSFANVNEDKIEEGIERISKCF